MPQRTPQQEILHLIQKKLVFQEQDNIQQFQTVLNDIHQFSGEFYQRKEVLFYANLTAFFVSLVADVGVFNRFTNHLTYLLPIISPHVERQIPTLLAYTNATSAVGFWGGKKLADYCFNHAIGNLNREKEKYRDYFFKKIHAHFSKSPDHTLSAASVKDYLDKIKQRLSAKNDWLQTLLSQGPWIHLSSAYGSGFVFSHLSGWLGQNDLITSYASFFTNSLGMAYTHFWPERRGDFDLPEVNFPIEERRLPQPR